VSVVIVAWIPDQVLQARKKRLPVGFQAQEPQGNQDAGDPQPVVVRTGEHASPALETQPGHNAPLVTSQAEKRQESLEGA
jgi:hypothetical protein